MQRPKRVAAINDLSVFGRCALSIITPVISVMGSQVLAIPTTLLSTHTGGFKNISSVNCDGFIDRCAQQYSELGLDIDCIYSGYLANTLQLASATRFIDTFSNAFLVVDPVLGDGGQLYSRLSTEMVIQMSNLVSRSDLITPNTTEACLLTETKYAETFSKNHAMDLILALFKIASGNIIITGIDIDEIGKCNLCLEKSGRIFAVPCDIKKQSYHGTGDCFCATVVGSLMRGDSFDKAVCCATNFVEHCIDITADSGEPERDGIFLEPALSVLLTSGINKKIIEMR